MSSSSSTSSRSSSLKSILFLFLLILFGSYPESSFKAISISSSTFFIATLVSVSPMISMASFEGNVDNLFLKLTSIFDRNSSTSSDLCVSALYSLNFSRLICIFISSCLAFKASKFKPFALLESKSNLYSIYSFIHVLNSYFPDSFLSNIPHFLVKSLIVLGSTPRHSASSF
nr:MAG TPA: hypothetical protein [Caudoviricetes sp.]